MEQENNKCDCCGKIKSLDNMLHPSGFENIFICSNCLRQILKLPQTVASIQTANNELLEHQNILNERIDTIEFKNDMFNEAIFSGDTDYKEFTLENNYIDPDDQGE